MTLRRDGVQHLAEHEELRRLRPRTSAVSRSVIWSNSGGLLRAGDRDPVSAYRIISAAKASGVLVSPACELLEVSRSGYHDWSTGPARGLIGSSPTRS
jgi:hypothetical protein